MIYVLSKQHAVSLLLCHVQCVCVCVCTVKSCGVRFSLGWLINLQSRSAREERGGGGTKRGFSGAQGPARDQDPRDGEGERVTKGVRRFGSFQL